MDDYSRTEISVLFSALEERMDYLKHYPQEFSPEEAEALRYLYKEYELEAKYRGLIY